MNTMNKENILSKKHSSPWKSPKVNKKQVDKWKEFSQSSSEKRGLHLKSFSDNNIIDSSPFEKSDSSLSFIREDFSTGQEQIIQQLIKKLEYYEGLLTKSQIQDGEKILKQSTYKNYNRRYSFGDFETTTPLSKEYTCLKKENKALQEKLAIAVKHNDELTKTLDEIKTINIKIREEYTSLKKEKEELVDDISNLNDVVNMLVERENWIPPEELEEKIEEALIAAQTKENCNTKESEKDSLEDSAKIDASNDSLNTLVSIDSHQKEVVQDDDTTLEYEIMINDLKQQVENLTLALNKKSEALEKKETETKELYDEIKEYHEVFDALKEREDWIPPEEVEEIRGELYDVIVQKGFIETELQEKKDLIEELKKKLLA
ncbi:hypothetical protein BCR36DRAFT_413385 [Piromyces finnis]|uniref:Uncharacterized protein n=1 Tax=Piromyces finnis TaxID=1754191 RepID=A0A1Y1V5L7_9FUNG|nr:hypothetical protein BCR36DRAFT_413385 [Piromyces finnis]|eukprot:ORX47858.1 hypothetical protein BCR36DRAFT_413385 [Piromyces finnis]